MGGQGLPPEGITVPTASEGIAITNKNTDFTSQRRLSVPELSPGTALIPTSHRGRLRLGSSGALSEATQLVWDSGPCPTLWGGGMQGPPTHTHTRALALLLLHPTVGASPAQSGSGKGAVSPKA